MFIKSKNKKFDKLIIVAHPDDELIFYGSKLIMENNNKVICMTHSNTQRSNEFINLMNELNCGYIMLDHKDDPRIKNIQKEYVDYISNYIAKNRYKIRKIITHNSDGEYGHNFHIAVSNMVTNICKQLKMKDKLYYFSEGGTYVPTIVKKRKFNLMKRYYPSQYKVINKLKLRPYMERETST